MSTITDTVDEEEDGDDDASPVVGLSLDSVSTSVRFVAFWAAIALPFLYVPLLATGLEEPGQRQTFLLLVVVNAAALLLGQQHEDHS
ncbi:hypothetical protein [Halomicrococcus gelatinilyticus]|uniref:hypothetical protein n=1 Tax=Halomicrococcus gelatinilyticus TaxID=1702103 RepID=UPI002E1383B8